MKRRQFLKAVGVGILAVASPVSVGSLSLQPIKPEGIKYIYLDMPTYVCRDIKQAMSFVRGSRPKGWHSLEYGYPFGIEGDKYDILVQSMQPQVRFQRMDISKKGYTNILVDGSPVIRLV